MKVIFILFFRKGDSLDINATIKDILTNNDSLPFLFIGSGFTRRYLGAPDWVGLLKEFCEMIDPKDDFLFHKYNEEAKQSLRAEGKSVSSVNAVNSKIADIIEANFNIKWYNDDRFEKNRREHKPLIEEGISPFKVEIASYFDKLIETPYFLEHELEFLAKLSENSISGIITTNYDGLLEKFFELDRYVGQEELIFSDTLGLCEIYKIHGCSSRPASIVINSEDYAEFEAKCKYLVAKLLTIFVEHPIIFIGYSMQDENIKAIMDAMLDCLNEKQLLIFKKRFIFVEYLGNDEIDDFRLEEAVYSSGSGKTLTMTKMYFKDYAMLYEMLLENKTKYPTKILKKLKKDVYELVTSTVPTEKLQIMVPFEELEGEKDVEFVVGVGISQATDLAYASYSAETIYRDIVFNDNSFIADLLIEKTLPPHLSRTCGSMPFYKYLSTYSKHEIPEVYSRYYKTKIDEFYNTALKDTRNNVKETSIKEIREKYIYPKSLYYVTRLDPKRIIVKELQEYLAEILSENPDDICTGTKYPYSSDLRRLIKILDWLMYYNKKS